MADKQGFLTKEGGSIKTGKKSWCVLKRGAIYYSKNQSSNELGVIALKGLTPEHVRTSNRKRRKHCFEVETPSRTYYLCAVSENEKQAWMEAIIGYLKSSAPQPGPNGEVKKPGKITLEDFDLLNVIGKGSFGKVLQVRMKTNGKIYAMKVLNKKTIVERNELEHTQAEKNILQKLVHPFLVNLNYSFQTSDKLYFVMDYVNGGELFFHLQKEEKFNEPRVRFYAAEIACGLEYLHNSGVLYRDLKPENVLLTGDGHICMTDFGISKEGLEHEDDTTSTFCGTPEYLAPEVLKGKGYGKAVDWWSYGTLLFEMLTGLPPFYSQDVQEMYHKILHAPLTIPAEVSQDASDLLKKLLEREPDKRLTDPKKIKAHPFFKGFDWDACVRKELTPPFKPDVTDLTSVNCVDEVFLAENPKLSVERSDYSLTIPDFTYVAAGK
jgi:serine/threonine protein kinase